MLSREKHTEGFTLAELLMTIAIILVLTAIAVPSIITAQNNMRMVELNNAAEAIANAAQTQMTAKKTSGTWLALIGDADKNHNYITKYPSPDNPTDTDTYYMVASSSGTLKGARENGIVPSLSIDDQVRNGDFVIVFKASTASVVSVFYTDGKSGFFDTPPTSTTAAQDYYSGGSGSIAQSDRMQNNPMIGYYQGTPASATPAIALENPVIWVDEDSGRLCVQDPNLSSSSSTTTTSKVKLEKKNADGTTYAFEISNLNKTLSILSVSTAKAENPETLSISNPSVSKVVKLLNREGLEDSNGNVFYIDLNVLVSILTEEHPDSGLVGILNNFAEGDGVNVLATTTLEGTLDTPDAPDKCVPSTARAVIEWPAPVGRLSLLVETPWSETLAKKEITGASNPDYLSQNDFRQPQVEATTTSGTSSVTIAASPIQQDFALKESTSNAALMKKNKQNGWQSYVGSSVGYSKAADDPTFVLKATVGSYEQSNPSSTTSTAHTYQPWELWAQKSDGEYTRVGYVRNGVWEWTNERNGGVNYAPLGSGLTWHDATGNSVEDIAGKNMEELGIVSMSVNANGWGAIPSELGLQDKDGKKTIPSELGLQDKDGNVTLYLRTAPRISEVKTYFDTLAANKTLLSEMTDKGTGTTYNKMSARDSKKTVDTTAGTNFEKEFGTSTSDVAWSIVNNSDGNSPTGADNTDSNATGFDNGNTFVADRQAVRVHYSISPGFGFDNIKNAVDPYALPSTEVTDASLFMYLTSTDGKTLEKQSEAKASHQSELDQYWYTHSQDSTDFELNTLEDYRFYRAITYYGEDGTTKLEISSQYAPYTDMSAKIAEGPGKTEEELVRWEFAGWETSDMKEYVGTITLKPGETVANLDKQLSYTGAKLKATYKSIPKATAGLMYLEFTDGAVTSYYGSPDGVTAPNGTLRDDKEIDSWGYFVTVPKGTTDILEYESKSLTRERKSLTQYGSSSVSIGDLGEYDLYYAPGKSQDNSIPSTTQTYTFFCGGSPTTLTYNLNFAAAVTTETVGGSGSWGTDYSPWNIRHVEQFGVILKYEQNRDSQYHRNSYLQTHDISFSAHQLDTKTLFMGIYDGNNYSVLDFDMSKVHIPENNGEIGLFPQTENATLRNISIKLAPGDQLIGNGGVDAVGILVGRVISSTVENCVVKGVSGESPSVVQVSNEDGEDVNVGGLIGQGFIVSLVNCGVSNISFELINTGTANGSSLSFGGLVGEDGGDLKIKQEDGDSVVVGNVTFTVNEVYPWFSAEVSAGGILGKGRINESNLDRSSIKEIWLRHDWNRVPITNLIGWQQ